MVLYSGKLIIGRISAPEIRGAYFQEDLCLFSIIIIFFFLGGGAYYRNFTVYILKYDGRSRNMDVRVKNYN